MPPTLQFRLFDYETRDEVPATDDDSGSSGPDSRKSGSGGSGGSSRRPRKPPHQFTIYIFGMNEAGQTACFIVRDFRPFFFIKVPEDWTEKTLLKFREFLQGKIGEFHMNGVQDMQFVKRKDLYLFTESTPRKFVAISFRNMATLNRVKGLWFARAAPGGEDDGNRRKAKPLIYDGNKLKLFESNIPPLLRFFHKNNISPSGWVQVAEGVSPVSKYDKRSTCFYEFHCRGRDITPLPDKETPVPLKICSFDIEASSSYGDFPVPIKTYKRLAIQMVDMLQSQMSVYRGDPAKMKRLMRNMISAAFGHLNVEGIDRVFPKTEITKQELDEGIAALLDGAAAAPPQPKARRAAELFRLDTVFRPLAVAAAPEEAADSDDEASADEAADDAAAPEEGPSDNGGGLLHYLADPAIKRDPKIDFLNKHLTEILPELEGDRITFIGSTFVRAGEKEPYRNHCLALGTCGPVEGTEIHPYPTEDRLLVAWTDLIQQENPDIIIGYNIFGFDYEFMFIRAHELGCVEQFIRLSRLRGHASATKRRGGGGGDDDDTPEYKMEQKKITIASGPFDMKYFNMIGRFQIDLYTYFRREFAMSSYKLDDVSSTIICDAVSRSEMHPELGQTWLTTKNTKGIHAEDFIHLEKQGYSNEPLEGGRKFRVVAVRPEDRLLCIDGLVDLSAHKGVQWGLAKDDVSPQDIFRLGNGTDADRAIVAKYCIQDCNIVHQLFMKIDILTAFSEMARICSIPMKFLVFRGQGIKLMSCLAKYCRERGTLMPDLTAEEEDADMNYNYEGAIVLAPKCGMYIEDPVACVDYSSLYPSLIISNNFSMDAKIWTREYNTAGVLVHENRVNAEYDNLPGYDYLEVEYDNFIMTGKDGKGGRKVITGRTVCRWAQFPDGRKGIIPSILEDILKARKSTRKAAAKEADDFMKNILDKRQLAYKITANSIYGQCGSRTSAFYDKDIASCTTASGKKMIIYAKTMVEDVYGSRTVEHPKFGAVLTRAEYIYGDSVAHYTPVYVRVAGGCALITTIEELSRLYGGDRWVADADGKEYCELAETCVETWSERGWTRVERVIRHGLAAHKQMVRVLTHTGVVDVTDDHSLLTAAGEPLSPKDAQVGMELLHCPLPAISEEERPTKWNRQYEAAVQYARLVNCGVAAEISVADGVEYIVQPAKTSCQSPNKIRQMYPIPYPAGEYVYDLTTANHHFSAGVGELVVHNTDSVFMTFNLQDAQGKKIVGKQALEITIELAQDVARLCSLHLKRPMELTYEKTLMPFIILSKKRYVGMLYENDTEHCKLKFMGLVLKRRDNCDYLKDVYGDILDKFIYSTGGQMQAVQEGIEVLGRAMEKLLAGQVPMEKLTLTKALRDYYKNPQGIAHAVLAARIGERDPGNKPKPGDRIQYAFFENPKAKLQGDRIETPEFICRSKLKLDLTYYITNQLMKPLLQLLGLVAGEILEVRRRTGTLATYRRDNAEIQRKWGHDLEAWMKNREKYASAVVKRELFDPLLIKIRNQTAGQTRTLQDFWAGPKV